MEQALLTLLHKAANEFSGQTLQVLDIGIFPWFSSIQVSFLFADDKCDREDIAAWPCFDYSDFNEGGWPEVEPYTQKLAQEWNENRDIVGMLKREALMVNSPQIQAALSNFKLADDFTVQILNPDDLDSPNYCI